MTVVLVCSTSDCTGVATHVLALVEVLRKVGADVTVVVPYEGWLTYRLRDVSEQVVLLRCRANLFGFFLGSVRLWRRVRRLEPGTFVHFHGRFPQLIGLLSVFAIRAHAYVITQHEEVSPVVRSVVRPKQILLRLSFRAAKRIWCVSEAVAQGFVRFLPEVVEWKLRVIRNWYEPTVYLDSELPSDFVVRKPEPSGGLRACTIARLSADKGVDVLVRAVGALKDAHYRIKCDIFGSGSERNRLLRLIRGMDLSEHITLRGQVDEAWRAIPAYDAVVVPSFREAFGFVVLEAYAMRVPVVVSSAPGLMEIVEPGVTGLVFPVGDHRALAARLQALFDDKTLRARLAYQGRARLSAEFDADTRKLTEVREFYELEPAS